MLGPALYTHLTGNSSVAALVGTRIYPVTLPQDPVLPCITYQVVAEPRVHALDGASAPMPYVQIDCWAATYLAAGGLADVVSGVLDSFRGTLGGTLSVSACRQRSRREVYEPETKEHRVSLDFSITHN